MLLVARLSRTHVSRIRNTCWHMKGTVCSFGSSGTPPKVDTWSKEPDEFQSMNRVAIQGAGFPDFIEMWDQNAFKKACVALGLASVGSFAAMGPMAFTPWVISIPTSLFIYTGIRDMRQKTHAIRYNFPVLGNLRYVLELLGPEIRQYFIESDNDASPFSREDRATVYQRAKNMPDTVAFGTRRDVYAEGYEWALHSLYPKHLDVKDSRCLVGGANPKCTQPYDAARLNVSAMSFGALSENAIRALNTGARMGGFYHNTGEGGISRFHKEPGGDLVWNVGTGYFGCGKGGMHRTFDPDQFVLNATLPQVKMIELKLSQGAKPGHGGMLPKEKITPTIAEARGLGEGPFEDCNSPPGHSAFDDAAGLVKFLQRLQDLSGGKPVGMKLCVGQPSEMLEVVQEMCRQDFVPDFITVDGSEGGTGAAPHEFSNRIGMPLQEGLYILNNMLRGANLRHRTRIIASGKVTTGFGVVRNIAMGADICNAARAMMFALGCIQALKCNTNTCPTGITTQKKHLMAGLDVPSKAVRVKQYQEKTVKMALEIVGAMGLSSVDEVAPRHVMRRVSKDEVLLYNELFPRVPRGCLLDDNGFIDFDKIDKNHDGTLSVDELKQFYSRAAENKWEHKYKEATAAL